MTRGAAVMRSYRGDEASGGTVSVLRRALGWLSVALGTAPLLSPSASARLGGVDLEPRNLALLRAVGGRELVVAAGLLGLRSPAWLWARVGQDAMDVPLALVNVRGKRGTQRTRAEATLAVLVAITAVDIYAALRVPRADTQERLQQPSTSAATAGRDDHMTRIAAVTINRSGEDVRRLWEGSKDQLAPVEDIQLTAAPGGRGTEVRVSYEEGGLADKLKAVAGKDARRQVEDALRRFKQVLETGQVVRSEGSPGGTDAAQQRHQRPAQPAGTP